jgi:hypothetical protein
VSTVGIDTWALSFTDVHDVLRTAFMQQFGPQAREAEAELRSISKANGWLANGAWQVPPAATVRQHTPWCTADGTAAAGRREGAGARRRRGARAWARGCVHVRTCASAQGRRGGVGRKRTHIAATSGGSTQCA